MISSVFFDLDGTLADTAPDLTSSLNQVLREQNKPSVTVEKIRPFVSMGSNAMLKVAFLVEEDDPEFADIKQRFLETYKKNLHHETQLFPGMEKVLQYLEKENIIWGVVTNKPTWLTEPTMQYLQLIDRVACVVSGDTTKFQKPDPQPILHACKVTKSDPNQSVYIGDASRDIDAGRAAGMKTLVASYGYIAIDEDPNEWNADGNAPKPEAIIYWLKKENSSAYL